MLILALLMPVAAHALVCGDGLPDLGEECDLGAANGAPDTCCTSDCHLRASGEVCRAAAGACDAAETCNGLVPLCPSDLKSTDVCRPSAGKCDVPEVCDGLSDVCPPDDFAPPFTVCRVSAGACDVAETCSGASAFCPADAKSTAVCRPSAGPCDVAESCDGVADVCPPDVKSTGGRGAGRGGCDGAAPWPRPSAA